MRVDALPVALRSSAPGGSSSVRSRGILAVLALAALAAAAGCRFPPPRVHVPTDPSAEVLARGQYVAEHVAICTTCHSDRDWRWYGGPPRDGTAGAGGESFTELFLFPDEVVLQSTDLTPSGLGSWTDGEVARAIAGGLDPDGRMIFLMMPVNQYRTMARPDLEAVIAWLRTLPPAGTTIAERDLHYRVLRDVGWMFVAPPALQDAVPGEPGSVRRGRYLANMASCRWCHTSTDVLGFPVPGYDWAGGMGFPVPEPGGGWVFSPNITPDDATGIGRWTREQFVARFKATTPAVVHAAPMPPGGFNSPMAWSAYSGLTEEDLSAIFAFLRTRPAVRNAVPRWAAEAPRRKRSGLFDFDAP